MQLQVSVLSQIPIYEQIEQQIKEQIFSGKLKAGDKLPSIRMLARELKIGVITSKRAYDDLCNQGVLISHAGKGIFVGNVSTEDAKKAHLLIIEERLRDIKQTADEYALSKDEIINLLDRIYGGQSDERN